jgi:hypothetical protein
MACEKTDCAFGDGQMCPLCSETIGIGSSFYKPLTKEEIAQLDKDTVKRATNTVLRNIPGLRHGREINMEAIDKALDLVETELYERISKRKR